MAETTADLITLAKANAAWPILNAKLTDAQILALATADMRKLVFPAVLKARQDYYVQDLDHPITATKLYRMPGRAHGSRLNDVLYVQNDGTEISLIQTRQSEVGERGREGGFTQADITYRLAFFMAGDFVGLDPVPTTANDTLRLRYYLAPAKFVPEVECAQITGITLPKNLSFASGTIPASWSDNFTYDIVSDKGPGDTLALEQALSTPPTLTAIVLVDDVPDSVQEGDWIALAGESPVVSTPDGGYQALVDLLVSRMHRAEGDQKAAMSYLSEGMAALGGLIDLLSDRVDGEAEIYVPNSSPMRVGTRGGWRR